MRHECLLLVASRHTITATKVIIRARITHTCYHCLGARFWLKIQAPICPFIGVSASLSARLSRKDGQGPPETPRSGPNLSMTHTKGPRPMNYKRQGSTDQSSIDFLDVSSATLSFSTSKCNDRGGSFYPAVIVMIVVVY